MRKLVVIAALMATSPVFGGAIESKAIAVNPARITSRTVLADVKDNNGGVLVQVIAEQLGGSTDVSNTHRIILAVSQISEMTEKEASFEIARSMGLTSARRLSGGMYQVKYNDAESLDNGTGLEVTKTIDARDAVNLVKNGPCAEFEVCKVRAKVSVR